MALTIMPISGTNRVNIPFCWREYWNKGKLIKEHHNGQDIVPTRYAGEAVPESAWNVREVTGGTVQAVSAGYNAGRGTLVKVKTAAGDIEIYQHLKSVCAQAGQALKQGDVLGVAGSTGNVTGRHLHFEVQRGGAVLNPEDCSGGPSRAGIYTSDEVPEKQEDKQYAATVLVAGLRLRPYPVADDGNGNEAIASVEKGKTYPLRQTRGGWAFLLTEDAAGGWCAIEGDDGTKYLDIREA